MANMTPADIAALKNGQSGYEGGQADAYVLGTELFKSNPSYLGRYYNRGNKKMTTLSKINLFFPGRLSTAPSDSPVIGHLEGVHMRDTFKVSAIAAGSTTNEAIITVDPADQYDRQAERGPVTKQVRARVQDTLEFVAGGDKYVVVAKPTSTTLTIRSFSGTAPSAEITVGATARVGAPIKSEGTDQIAPLIKNRVRWENRFWISDETDVVTGSHLTSRSRILPDGRIYLEGVRDAELRLEYAKSDIFLFGQMVADTVAIGMYSEPLKDTTYLSGTQGLLDYADMVGEEIFIDAAGMTIDDLYAITNIYHDNNFGVDKVLGLFGSNLNQKFDTALADKLNYTWVVGVSDQYVPADARPYWGNTPDEIQGQFMSIGFNGLELNGITFLKTAAPEFNDGGGAGAIGYKDWGVITPFSYIPMEQGNDIPAIGYQYRGTDGYSRENELWVVTGAGNRSILTGTQFSQISKSSEWDAAMYYLRTEIAPEFAGGDQYILVKPNPGS